MPPTLHPRSGATTTLFTGTLLLSFAVVALPHLLPCPVPHGRQYADSFVESVDEDGRPLQSQRPRQRGQGQQHPLDSTRNGHQEQEEDRLSESTSKDVQVVRMMDANEQEPSKDRECPVPKPTGLVGRLMGFTEDAAQRRERAILKIGAEKVARREKGEGEEG